MVLSIKREKKKAVKFISLDHSQFFAKRRGRGGGEEDTFPALFTEEREGKKKNGNARRRHVYPYNVCHPAKGGKGKAKNHLLLPFVENQKREKRRGDSIPTALGKRKKYTGKVLESAPRCR